MSAIWQKNEPTAAKRRCDLIVQSAIDGSKAPRGTNLAAYLYITQGGNDFVAAVGTIANKRRALSFTSGTFTATAATDLITKTAHGLETGDGPFRVSNSGGALPGGLAALTDYYVISSDTNNIKLATSLANAYAGTAIDITSAGTGTQTLAAGAGCQRGIDGLFCYSATQAETNYDAAELVVAVLGHPTYEAYTTVNRPSDGAWGDTLEAGISRDGALRVLLRGEAAKYSVDGAGNYVHRDIADTKNSHHGTITASGRITAVIDDAT